MSAIEDGMLNSRRVERSVVLVVVVVIVAVVGSFRGSSADGSRAIQSPDLPLARARRCAHLDKLNYKLDGSLVATRGNVVGA